MRGFSDNPEAFFTFLKCLNCLTLFGYILVYAYDDFEFALFCEFAYEALGVDYSNGAVGTDDAVIRFGFLVQFGFG